MKIGVLLLNFGEPEHATMEEVVPFLERIFLLNSSLERRGSDEVRRRARELAEERAPGLIEEYEAIGGSPLHRQAQEQAEALERELSRRRVRALVRVGMQFTEPSIGGALDQVRDGGVDRVVGLPVYPLCGPSTTVAALEQMGDEIRRREWEVPAYEVTGWHRHPAYLQLRANAVRAVLDGAGLSLSDPATKLVFSAHGTPMKYIREGSAYDSYVRDFCASLAEAVGAPEYLLGYQNHGNRPGVEWTQPPIDEVIREVEAAHVVVDPVSFMHEQSETLAELDHELRGMAEARGLDFHRVPIRHDDPDFIAVLADLVEPFAQAEIPRVGASSVAGIPLLQCICKPSPGTRCLNAGMHR